MYNTTIECTYHSTDVFLETDKISEQEKNFVRSCVYRQEILNIFGLDEFDQDLINNKVSLLYEKMKEEQNIKKCIEEVLQKMNIPLNIRNDKLGFLLLFSYDLLYITNDCVCEFLNNGNINKNTIKLLENAISSM